MNAKRLSTVLAGIAVVSLMSSNAAAYDRSVDITNIGGNSIYSVEITHIDYPSWGPDLLGPYMIGSGQSMLVFPHNPSGYCRFDVRITYTNSATVQLRDLNLCNANEIVAAESRAYAY